MHVILRKCNIFDIILHIRADIMVMMYIILMVDEYCLENNCLIEMMNMIQRRMKHMGYENVPIEILELVLHIFDMKPMTLEPTNSDSQKTRKHCGNF